MEKMPVKDFALDFYQEGEIWYLYHTKDELAKKHKDPGQLQSGYLLKIQLSASAQ